MIRSIAVAVSVLAVVPSAAHAAPKSCTREGAKLLAAAGGTRVVSVREKARNAETRRDRIYGCWTASGRRFTLFLQRDFGLDLIERADIEIVDGRYIGVVRDFEGGVSESRTAATWDAQKHVALRNSKPCDAVSTAISAASRTPRSPRTAGSPTPATAACASPTTKATASSSRRARTSATSPCRANYRGFKPRLYWTAGTTLKSLDL